MALNIFPRRKETLNEPAAAPELVEALPEPSPEALDGSAGRRTRRGSRGGRGRGRGAADATAEATDTTAAPADEADHAASAEPAPRARRAPRRPAEPEAPETAAAPAADTADGASPAVARRRAPRRRGADATETPVAADTAAQPDEAVDTPPPAHPAAIRNTRPDGDTVAILRAIEAQGRQIEQLARAQEELARRPGGGGGAPAPARPARVGVFVDAANIELACDRLRARFDWSKVLRLLTQDRQLVRAVAYSPVHDDPGVSIETQRFAEPFLGRGFKVVTKALKRFADGSVKANVDIELALDVVSMIDRLDVVCLVSGDGDFQPLVEFVQRHGVRCEVIAVASSTAGQLRNAADEFIDLGNAQRLRDIRA